MAFEAIYKEETIGTENMGYKTEEIPLHKEHNVRK